LTLDENFLVFSRVFPLAPFQQFIDFFCHAIHLAGENRALRFIVRFVAPPSSLLSQGGDQFLACRCHASTVCTAHKETYSRRNMSFSKRFFSPETNRRIFSEKRVTISLSSSGGEKKYKCFIRLALHHIREQLADYRY
jgi:hypothetical protein